MWSTITDCFSETREYKEPSYNIPSNLLLHRLSTSSPVIRVTPRDACGTHVIRRLPALMTRARERARENKSHKSLTSESFCLRAVSHGSFLSSSPRNRASFTCGSRWPSRVSATGIYSRSSKTPCRRTIRSINPLAARAFFIRYFIVMVMRGYVYLYGCLRGATGKARLIAATSNHTPPRPCFPLQNSAYRTFFSI